jgi:hypothetical protein
LSLAVLDIQGALRYLFLLIGCRIMRYSEGK